MDPPTSRHILFDSFTPCRTVTPYDYHGLKHQREVRVVLAEAGIQCVQGEEKSRIENPVGSGAGGRVRFGDDMLPSNYFTFVLKEDEAVARDQWNAHRKAVEDWVFNEGPRPAIFAKLR